MPQILPMVGMHYRPPAKAIVDNLRVGTPLHLRAEPDNPYDPNAIQIFIKGIDIPEDYDLDQALNGYGTNLAETRARFEIHLGYVPRGLAATFNLIKDKDYPGPTGSTPAGNPRSELRMKLCTEHQHDSNPTFRRHFTRRLPYIRRLLVRGRW